jgi:hypothetical protein
MATYEPTSGTSTGSRGRAAHDDAERVERPVDSRPDGGPAATPSDHPALPPEPELSAEPATTIASDDAAVAEGTQAQGFLPAQPQRLASESVFVRIIATLGIIGIGTALGAILVANSVDGWITGLVVSAVSVVLAAVMWRSRRL